MAIPDPGPPTAYLALEVGTPVYARDGARVGTVEHVLADSNADIFEGLVLDVPGGGRRFAEAEEITDMYERAVVLALDREAVARLPEPAEGGGEGGGDGVSDRLRRAWDAISGRD